jgi:UDP-N-acetyl-D-mannosaminuronic acid dehydrogenase
VSSESVAELIRSRSAKVGVVGVGYVGTAAAAVIAGSGFDVLGLDVNQQRVDAINDGRVPFEGDEPELPDLLHEVVTSGHLRATNQASSLGDRDVVLFCVDTPVGADHVPRFEALRAACASVGPHLKQGTVVVVESTLAPGTVDRVVKPALEEASGGKEGSRFLLGHCPERVMPGKLLRNIRTMDRVLGAYSKAGHEAMRALYESYVGGHLDDTDPLSAELVKTAENAYRDVNIAFANELALICERAGGDVWKVRELVNRSPGRNVLLPGSGVGGHCIPKDPWLLASALGDEATNSLLASARRVNDEMPRHCADLVGQLVQGKGVIAVFGYSYLEESGDTRNSPSAALVSILGAAGHEVRVHDPFVPDLGGDPMTAARGADCVVVMVAHRMYKELDLGGLAGVMRQRNLVDTRAVFEPHALANAGLAYRRLGSAAPSSSG